MTTRRAASFLLGGWVAGTAVSALQPAQADTMPAGGVLDMPLDGVWDAGLERRYDRRLRVPGLATDPSKPTPGTLWHRRTVSIPLGPWTQATLTLKGARFAPKVYVDGVLVSSTEGGMAATRHGFVLPANAVGGALTLEIALSSLDQLDPMDASATPGADRWRSNVSSCLWDAVVLRLHGPGEIVGIAPTSDIERDTVSVAWRLAAPPASGAAIRLKLIGPKGRVLVERTGAASSAAGRLDLALAGRVEPWTPEIPRLYRLRAELIQDGQVIDAVEQAFGHREFVVRGLAFELNGRPYPIRMGTVVWHRWARDPEAREIAFDPAWFERNVVLRLKSLGANALRFHLGLPPESFLDLCDRHGLAVQMEWPFFHGIAASSDSMGVQWAAWLDTAARHPCVVIIQPWNETGGDQLIKARQALGPLLAERPPLVVCHQDVTPIHKYWWSLFENLGLYYDSAEQFGRAVTADEFGGNYLDGNGDPGLYPTTREAFLRFLGRDNTREERLALHADSNARVAEYWRRLGVAGFSPFTILGSPQDGSHWFLGRTDVATPKPKPVWRALSAAFARRGLSLEIWNRNFMPGERIEVPLWFFNDGDRAETFKARIRVIDVATEKDVVRPVVQGAAVSPRGRWTRPVALTLPKGEGEWRIEAVLDGLLEPGSAPVVSSWRVRTLTPRRPAALANLPLGVAEEEVELRAMLERHGCLVVSPTSPEARVIVGGTATWAGLSTSSGAAAINRTQAEGRSIVLLDAGPAPLGVGYEAGAGRGGPLEGAPVVGNPRELQRLSLFGGVDLAFIETAEPESAIHAPVDDAPLWRGLPKCATQLWNGLRGGLIVPAATLQVSGLSGPAVLALWATRGADADRLQRGAYFAYELAGYYAFAQTQADAAVREGLRRRVKFLVEDAPALAGAINPDASIKVTDLNALYRASASAGAAESVSPLALAGQGLSRTPVVKLTFGAGKGAVIVSQLLTAGRLGASASGEAGVYALRQDPAAEQLVLNMIAASL